MAAGHKPAEHPSHHRIPILGTGSTGLPAISGAGSISLTAWLLANPDSCTGPPEGFFTLAPSSLDCRLLFEVIGKH